MCWTALRCAASYEKVPKELRPQKSAVLGCVGVLDCTALRWSALVSVVGCVVWLVHVRVAGLRGAALGSGQLRAMGSVGCVCAAVSGAGLRGCVEPCLAALPR